MKPILLRILPERKISDLQAEFSEKFPFLRLEIFQNYSSYHNHQRGQELPHQETLSQAQLNKKEGIMVVDPGMTVRELEKKLKEDYSMIAQVLRRSGNIWLQTTMTDDWTLEQQNAHGKELSIAARRIIRNGRDYDLTRDAD